MVTNQLLRSMPNEWQVTKIKDVTSVRDDRTVNDGEFVLCSLTIEAGVVEKPERYVREFLVKSRDKKYKKVCPNDIVFNPMNLRWGAIAISKLDKAGILSPVYNVLSVNENADVDYLALLLKSSMMIQVYNKFAQGTLVERTGVNLKEFVEFPIPYPPLPEQRKIAAILTSVDDAITATQRIIDQTEVVKRGLMQQLLTKGIGHTTFKRTEIGEIPTEWDVVTIGGCCYILDNKRVPLSQKERETMSGDIPYYGATKVVDFIDRWLFDEDIVLIGEDGDHFKKFRIWSMTSLVRGKSWVNNHAHVLKAGSMLTSDRIYLFLDTNLFL